MDCEMVGVGPGRESGLARCSLVDVHGAVLYDKFIRPEGKITDYRTQVSGVTPTLMAGATPFAVARREVSGSEGHPSPNTDTLPVALIPLLLELGLGPQSSYQVPSKALHRELQGWSLLLGTQ